MPKNTRLVLALLTLSVSGLHAEPAAPVETGYTVMVEFDVDSAGAVTNAKVVASEEKSLDPFALAMVEGGEMLPNPLPAAGSPPKQVRAPVFFPVANEGDAKPLPPGTVLPKPKFQYSPAYPFELRKKGVIGGVRVSLTIGKNGRVKSCRVFAASHPEFASAAEQAVSKWEFRPATLNGKAIEVTMNVPISFELEGKARGWRWLVAPSPTLPSFATITDQANN